MIELALLWHMHQPSYEDLVTREHFLPWVRLHGLKDYLGMVQVLDEFPAVRVTFNLVPSLVMQLEAFASDEGRDAHLAVGLTPADALTPADRAFLVANAFHAPFERMIAPYPRYAELFARRHAADTWTVDDLRDLQVWHKLAWMDPDWLAGDARLTALVARGRAFTEADKARLREVELDILRAIVPAYRRAAERGQIELSTSPFYHPILPLLCDTDVHLHAHPGAARPARPFRWPADARAQLERAVAFHTARFGARPDGVWPSEGAVSDEVVELIHETGFRWTATDEAILGRSLGGLPPGALYRPYDVGKPGRSVRCLFRDHELSDLIGFTYQSWDARQAADDFVARVRAAGKRHAEATHGEPATVAVILDGENAWEHYAGGGRPFLRALYGALAQARDIRLVTMREAVGRTARPLASVFPGSWINADFYIWAGHADDQRAWTQLADAREAFERAAPHAAPEDRERAYEELLIAEGSDWFWWYGDDHSSDHDREFDELFRRHLRNVYRFLQLPIPDELFVSNISTGAPEDVTVTFERFSQPVPDGRVSSFAEWIDGAPVPAGLSGAMHQVGARLIRAAWLAAGPSQLWIRLDGPDVVHGVGGRRLKVLVQMTAPTPQRIELVAARAPRPATPFLVADRIVEGAVPYAAFGVEPGTTVTLALVVIDEGGDVVERRPAAQAIRFTIPAAALDAVNWIV